LILERCLAIWLDAEIDTLATRVSRRGHRPLLAGKDPGALLRELAEVRNPVYAEAHLRVMSDSGPHERTVERILEALAEHGR
jgi:shikimate kinase